MLFRSEKKFLETIAMIRANDPKLKQVQGEVFRDEDFEASSEEGNRKSDNKKVTYKDLIREDVLKKASKSGPSHDVDSSDSDNQEGYLFKRRQGKGETVAEEEERLKREFKEKARVEEAEESDDGFL